MKDDMPQPRKPDKIHPMWEQEEENSAKYYEHVSILVWSAFAVVSATAGGVLSWWLFAGGCGG